tara:strand:- start:231 stop:548 length:318 start_codon:yes stop_codon:yes gene_type:complete
VASLRLILLLNEELLTLARPADAGLVRVATLGLFGSCCRLRGMFLQALRLHHRVDSGVCLIIEVIVGDHDWAIIAHDAFGLALLLSMSQGHAARQDAHAVTQFFC